MLRNNLYSRAHHESLASTGDLQAMESEVITDFCISETNGHAPSSFEGHR